MTTGVALLNLSRRQAFLLGVALTLLCFVGLVFFAVDHPVPSMEFGFAVLTALLAATSAYAGWSWSREKKKPNRPVR